MATNKKQIKDFVYKSEIVSNDNLLLQSVHGTTFRTHVNDLPFTNNDYTTAGLATIEYVDDAISSIPTPAYNDYTTAGLATTDYVDDAVSDKATIAYVDSVAPQPIVKTYSELLGMMSTNGLVSGRWYEMSDYATTYPILGLKGTDVIQTGAIEPLRLRANSTNTFDKQVYSTLFPTDIIHYDITKSVNERRKEISVIIFNGDEVVQSSYFSVWNVGNTRQYIGWFNINDLGTAPVVAGAIIIPIPLSGDITDNVAYIDLETVKQAIVDAMTSDADFNADFELVNSGAVVSFTTIEYGNTNNIESFNFSTHMTVETDQDGIAEASRTGLIEYRKDPIKNLSAFYDWRKVKFRRWSATLDTIPATLSGTTLILQREFPWIGGGNPCYFIKPNFTGTVDMINDLNGVMGDIAVFDERGMTPVSLTANRTYLAFYNESYIYIHDVQNSLPSFNTNVYQEKDTNFTESIKAIVNTSSFSDFFTFGNQSDGGLLRGIEIEKTNSSDMPYNNIVIKTNTINTRNNIFKQGCNNITVTSTFYENEIGINSYSNIFGSMNNNKIFQINNCIFNALIMTNNIFHDSINECYISTGSQVSNNIIANNVFLYNYIIRCEVENNRFESSSVYGNLFVEGFQFNNVYSAFNTNLLSSASGVGIRYNQFNDTSNGFTKNIIYGLFSNNKFFNIFDNVIIKDGANFLSNFIFGYFGNVNIFDGFNTNRVYVEILNADITNVINNLTITDRSPDGSVWHRTISDAGVISMTKVVF